MYRRRRCEYPSETTFFPMTGNLVGFTVELLSFSFMVGQQKRSTEISLKIPKLENMGVLSQKLIISGRLLNNVTKVLEHHNKSCIKNNLKLPTQLSMYTNWCVYSVWALT